MTFAFDEKQLEKRIEQLSPTNRIAFAAACAERMAPSYEAYSRRTGFGDPKLFRELLGRLWADLVGQRMSDLEIEENIEKAVGLLPPEDEPWVPEYPVADDAAAALAFAIECRKTGSPAEAIWAARRAYDALDDHVITSEDIDTSAPEAESIVLSHPLIQAELARQSRDLDELGDGRITVDQLLDRAKAEASGFLPSLHS